MTAGGGKTRDKENLAAGTKAKASAKTQSRVCRGQSKGLGTSQVKPRGGTCPNGYQLEIRAAAPTINSEATTESKQNAATSSHTPGGVSWPPPICNFLVFLQRPSPAYTCQVIAAAVQTLIWGGGALLNTPVKGDWRAGRAGRGRKRPLE